MRDLIESVFGFHERLEPCATVPVPGWVVLAWELGEPFPDRLFAGVLEIYGRDVERAAKRINDDWRIAVEVQDREAFEVVMMEEEMLLDWIERKLCSGGTGRGSLDPESPSKTEEIDHG